MFGTFVRDYALALREAGISLRVIHLNSTLLPPFRWMKRYRSGLKDSPDFQQASFVHAAPFYILPGLAGFQISCRLAVRSVSKLAARLHAEAPAQIFHAHNLFPEGAIAAPVCRGLRLPLVITSHGTDNRVHAHHPQRRPYVDSAAAGADAIIGVSEKVVRDLRAAGVAASRWRTIHNGFYPPKDSVAPTSATEASPKAKPGRTILAVCHLDLIEKGIDILIIAFASLLKNPEFADCRVVIVGGGKQMQFLKDLAQKEGVDHAVDFRGPEPPAALGRYYRECDIFCLPSWSEAFGIVYLEAMSYGKPVLGVAGEGISELIVDGQNGMLLKPRDPVDCARALTTLLRSEELRCRMGAAGQAIANGLPWSKAARETIELYEEVLRVKTQSPARA